MGDSLKVRLEGDRRMVARIKQLAARWPQAHAGALYSGGVLIMRDAIPRTPSEEGELRDSAFVSLPIKTSRGTVVVFGYGAEHAIFVHERTDVQHTVGESKFLEKAIRAVGRNLTTFIARQTEKNIQSKVGVRASKGEFPTEPRS